ncbi:MAG: hypothetical protein MJ025_05755 [Victivallaceae bacterium]|nr:hypothetical protein [Victivallaceae bacterium]
MADDDPGTLPISYPAGFRTAISLLRQSFLRLPLYEIFFRPVLLLFLIRRDFHRTGIGFHTLRIAEQKAQDRTSPQIARARVCHIVVGDSICRFGKNNPGVLNSKLRGKTAAARFRSAFTDSLPEKINGLLQNGEFCSGPF